MTSHEQQVQASTPGIRAPRRSDRHAVLATVGAADLLPVEGIAEVSADLDGFLDGEVDGAWLVDRLGDTTTGIAGVAYYAPERMTEGAWNLLMIAVRPEHQGRGRGSALVRAVESDVSARGGRLLVIDTSGLPEFTAQRRFYAGLGYREQGRISDFYAPGDDKVVFVRRLEGRTGHDRIDSPRVPAEAGDGIRAGEVADLPRLLELATAFYQEDGFLTPADQLRANLSALIASHEARVAVAVVSNRVAAFAITTTTFGLENGLVAELEDMFVQPATRRAGVGTKLVRDAVEWAAGRGCAQVEVVVAPNGRVVDDLHHFYAALGFLDQGRRLRSRPLP